MISNNSLSRQLPDFISQDPYISELLKTKAFEYDTLDEFKADIKQQLFVDTATWGLVLWEKALGLPVVRTNTNIYPLEEDNPELQLFGHWTTIAAGGTNGKIVRCDATDGDNWVKIEFWGTGLRLIRSATTPDECQCNIHLDTVYYKAENKSVNNPSNNEVFFEVKDLPWGIHSLRMSFEPLATGLLNNRYCSLDRAEVINSLAEGYDKRRAMVKAKLLPIRNVTNQTVRDLAAAYGFHNLILDESVPYVYRVEFNSAESSSYELRKQIFSDLKKIIPAHIELKKKVMVSTFKDIDTIGLCWNEIADNYYYNDFFDLGTVGPLEKYNYLNKYFDLSIFSYQSFNSDNDNIDTRLADSVFNNMHTVNHVLHKNIVYDNTLTNAQISAKFSDVNRKLLTDAERLQLYRIGTQDAIAAGHTLTFTEPINKFDAARTKLKHSVNYHPFLAAKGVNVLSNDLTAILAPISNFAGDINFGTIPVIAPNKIVYGKVTYDGTNYATGNIMPFDIQTAYATLSAHPDGVGATNCFIPSDFNIPVQTDLVPENILKDITMYGVTGTFVPAVDSKYVMNDILFPWQLQTITSDSTIFKIKY